MHHGIRAGDRIAMIDQHHEPAAQRVVAPVSALLTRVLSAATPRSRIGQCPREGRALMVISRGPHG